MEVELGSEDDLVKNILSNKENTEIKVSAQVGVALIGQKKLESFFHKFSIIPSADLRQEMLKKLQDLVKGRFDIRERNGLSLLRNWPLGRLLSQSSLATDQFLLIHPIEFI